MNTIEQQAREMAAPVQAGAQTVQQEPIGYALDNGGFDGSVIRSTPLASDFVPVYLAAGAQPVPAGYQLAPMEPTPAMLEAGWKADRAWQASDDESVGLAVIYKAMMTAAKEQP